MCAFFGDIYKSNLYESSLGFIFRPFVGVMNLIVWYVGKKTPSDLGFSGKTAFSDMERWYIDDSDDNAWIWIYDYFCMNKTNR